MRTNRVLLAATATVLAFALTGCGSEEGGAKVPTAGGDASTSASAPAEGGGTKGKGALATYVEGKRAWVKCMRENGIQLNDPDDKGQIDYGNSLLKYKKDPKFLTATEKCESIDPPLPEGLEESLNPLTPQEIETRRKYADCMQKNGAPDFPDPGSDGHGGNSSESEWDQSSAGAQRATRMCAPIIGDPTNPPAGKG